MGEIANIKDVALRAGVGIATVSRVINNSKNVSPEVRVKVERAIAEVGYSANQIARGLKSVQTGSIAVLISSISHVFFTQVLKGISATAGKYGYSVFVAETDGNLETEKKLVRSFAAQWVDGIILSTVAYGQDENTRTHLQSLGNLQKNGVPIPVVTLECPIDQPQVDAVVVDHAAAAQGAMEHLLSLGRTEILHIALPPYTPIAQARRQVYEQTLRARGLEVREDRILEGNHTTHSGYEIVRRILERGTPVDGIFSGNDRMAVGAILACNECGVRIPDRMAVIGMGDVFVNSIVSPSLSSIHIPQFEMGATAMELLHKRLAEGKKRYKRQVITMDTHLVARESTVPGTRQGLEHLDW